jgi:hypothetical protein
MRKCVFMDNDRWCSGGIWFMIVCVQEEYSVMDYDKSVQEEYYVMARRHMVRWMMITSLRNMVWSNSPGSAWCRMIL